MKYLLQLAVLLCLAGCSPGPDAKGTKTNWLRLCPDTSAPLTGRNIGDATNRECETPGALICESFEDPLLAEYGVAMNGEGLLALQDCVVFEGKTALARHSVDDLGATVRMPLPVPYSSGSIHLRARIYISPDKALPAEVTLFALRPQSDFSDDQISIRFNGEGHYSLQVGKTEVASSEPGLVEQGSWVCLEAALDLSGLGQGSLSIDGKEVLRLMGAQLPDGVDGYNIATVFGGVSNPEGYFEMVVDDYVLATQPIGCE